MDTKSSISVIIPTKNRSTLLKRAVESVLKQTISADEIIIINDGSDDNTASLLSDLSKQNNKLRIINRDKSGGVNVARNQGIKISKSQWVAFLDDDDVFLPTAIQVMKERLNTLNDQFSVVFFNTLIETSSEKHVGGFVLFKDKEFYDPSYEETMIKYGLKGDCKPLLRRKIFTEDNYWFDESINGQESIFFNTLARDGKKIRYFKDVLTHVYFDYNSDHLSYTAPRKKPKSFLIASQRKLTDHCDYYKLHKKELSAQYLNIFKLSIKLSEYGLAIKSMCSLFLAKAGLLRGVRRLPCAK